MTTRCDGTKKHRPWASCALSKMADHLLASRWVGTMVGIGVILLPHVAHAAMRLEVDGSESQQHGAALKMALILSMLSLGPALMLTTTSFVRIAVVMTFLRNALGTQNMPPTQVLMGLALFLTLAVMAPVGGELYQQGLEPYFDGKLSAEQAFSRGSAPLKGFMLRQTRRADLAMFYDITKTSRPKGPADVHLELLVPAFVISELRTAFEMGFVIYLPFLLIDLIVASILMALGMAMVPPAMLSLPLKIMLFVMADGWRLLASSLVRSFQ